MRREQDETTFSFFQDRKSLSPRREKFAQLVAGGAGKAGAYRQCYATAGMKQATLWSEASRLAAIPQVSAIIRDLQDAQAQATTHDTAQLRDTVVARLNNLANTAESESARVRALELLGKTCGLFVDRTEVITESLTANDLRTMLEHRLRQMFLVGDQPQRL